MLFLFIFNAKAEGQAVPRLDPEPKAVEFYKLGKKSGGQAEYTWIDLAQISLWASGDNSPSANLEKIRAMVNAVNNSR